VFSELPKLFDRDFAIGYFLPMACFVGALYGMLAQFHHTDLIQNIVEIKKIDTLLGTTLFGLAIWLISVILLIGNRSLYQLFEGYYWPLNTVRGKRREEDHFKHLSQKIDDTYAKAKQYRNDEKQVPPELLEEQADLLIVRAERFPYRRRHILATKFGNTIRAFETYPKAMYGIDPIEGWLRLLAVVPKDYRQMIDSAKAETDFWLNLWFLGYMAAVIHLIFAILFHNFTALWFLIIFLIFIVICRSAAITGAKEWGAISKAAFDVFLPELYGKLCLLPPSDVDVTSKENLDEETPEWKMWDAFSRAITYRDPSQLPPRQLGQKNSKMQAGDEEGKAAELPGKEKDTSSASSEGAGNKTVSTDAVSTDA